MQGTSTRSYGRARMFVYAAGGAAILLGAAMAGAAAAPATSTVVVRGVSTYLANASRNVRALFQGTPSRHQAKINRMFQGSEFERFQARNHPKTKHYANLATQQDLSSQVLFQLFRSGKVRQAREKRAARVPLRVAPTPGQRGFLAQHRSLRRYAYRTPFFAALKTNRMQALQDIRAALARPQVSHDERVELLRLAHALVRDRGDAAATLFARSLFLDYALGSAGPGAQDYTPHLAFAYYSRLETVPSVRQANGARFAQRPHAPIPATVARRMYSGQTYGALRGAIQTPATRVPSVGR